MRFSTYREYLRHRLIGTPLDPIAAAARRLLTRWQIRTRPEIADAIFEDDFLKAIVRRDLRDGDNCIDVGGHLGAMTSLFLKLSPHGRHICVEPTPYKAAWLRRRYPQVEIVEAALAENRGGARFYHQPSNSGYNGLAKHDAQVNDLSDVKVMNVNCETLDHIVPESRTIQLIKIDVEGAELKVLRGGKRVLRAHRPTILFEATQSGLRSNGIAAAELFDEVTAFGYRIRTPRADLERTQPLDAEGFERAMQYPFAAFSFVARTE